MPSATKELQDEWSDAEGTPTEEKAWAYLRGLGFNTWAVGGVIHPPGDYKPKSDRKAERAIDFLCQEWDFAYDPTPLPGTGRR